MWYNLFELFNKAWKITSDSESYNVGVGQRTESISLSPSK